MKLYLENECKLKYTVTFNFKFHLNSKNHNSNAVIRFITDSRAKMFLLKKKGNRTKMPANISFQEAFHCGCSNRHISALIKE